MSGVAVSNQSTSAYGAYASERAIGEPSSDEGADELARRDEHLPAEVTALLLRGELVLEVDAGRTRLDVRLHQLERAEGAAEAGLGVGDDRRQPVGAVLALGEVDLVGAQERVVEPLDERGTAVRRVERLVGVRLAREVRIGGDLPAGEVDRLQPRAHHLHRLPAGKGAQRGDVVLLGQELAEPLGAEARDRVLDREAAAKPLDVFLGVGPLHAAPAVAVAVHVASPSRCRGRARRSPDTCTRRAPRW